MTEAISYINDSLKEIYPPGEIKGFTHIIMERVCGLQPYQLLLGKGNDLSDKEKAEIKEIVGRLRKSEPIQYILGTASFYGQEFAVNSSVLIPRPETAELVDKIKKETTAIAPFRLLDIGTGSGCIAISLAGCIRQAEVYALDISEEALAVARRNAEALQADVRFFQADILSASVSDDFRKKLEFPPKENGISSEWNFQVIVSNPPYIMEKEQAEMEANVLSHEPHLALFVPDNDPLLFYRAIARLGKQFLTPDGVLYFEINAQCGNETKEMLLGEGYRNVELTQDIYGKDRIIKAYI